MAHGRHAGGRALAADLEARLPPRVGRPVVSAWLAVVVVVSLAHYPAVQGHALDLEYLRPLAEHMGDYGPIGLGQ